MGHLTSGVSDEIFFFPFSMLKRERDWGLGRLKKSHLRDPQLASLNPQWFSLYWLVIKKISASVSLCDITKEIYGLWKDIKKIHIHHNMKYIPQSVTLFHIPYHQQFYNWFRAIMSMIFHALGWRMFFIHSISWLPRLDIHKKFCVYIVFPSDANTLHISIAAP